MLSVNRLSAISFCGPSSRSSYGSSSGESEVNTHRSGSNRYRYRGGAPSETISNTAVRRLAQRHPVQYEQFIKSLDDSSKEVAREVKSSIKKIRK